MNRRWAADISEYFLAHLARRVSERLRTLPERHLRFLFVDDIHHADRLPVGSFRATAEVSEDGCRSFQRYEVTLHISDRARAAVPDSLPEPDDDGWLVVDRAANHITITLR